MSLYGVESFMFRLKNDARVQEAFRAGSDAAFADFDLTGNERTALREGDLVTLYKMGVHPLLLAPYSRYASIPRPRYQELLAPLKGLRTMRS